MVKTKLQYFEIEIKKLNLLNVLFFDAFALIADYKQNTRTRVRKTPLIVYCGILILF